MRSQIINAHDVELIDQVAFEWLHGHSQEVSAMLGGYIKHLSESASRIRGMRYTRADERRNWRHKQKEDVLAESIVAEEEVPEEQ